MDFSPARNKQTYFLRPDDLYLSAQQQLRASTHGWVIGFAPPPVTISVIDRQRRCYFISPCMVSLGGLISCAQEFVDVEQKRRRGRYLSAQVEDMKSICMLTFLQVTQSEC